MMVDQIPISRFSAMTKLSPKSLRHYEEKGLLEPIRDPINNYRYYGREQIEDAIRIKMLTTMGFGIEEMKSILISVQSNNSAFLDQIFQKKHTEIQMEIQRLQKLEAIIRSNKPMEMLYMRCTEPEIRETQKMRVITKCDRGSYEFTVPKLITELMYELQTPKNKYLVKITGPIMMITRDTEFKEQDADIEIALPVTGRINLENEDIELKYLDKAKVVSLIYTGPYNEIGVAYTRVFDYCKTHNLETISPAREIYLNDPNQVSDGQLMTELQIPINLIGDEY